MEIIYDEDNESENENFDKDEEFEYDRDQDADLFEEYSELSLLLASLEYTEEPSFVAGQKYRITIEEI